MLVLTPTSGALAAGGSDAATPSLFAYGFAASDRLSGFGLAGFDPVAYFADGKARPGLAAHEAVIRGVAWRFVGEANKAAFLANPAVYEPRFGGHDADAVRRGLLVNADPALFAVSNGRLYVFRTAEGRRRFLADARLAGEAAAAWRRLVSD